ncbi:MAG: hypothetical protein NXI04_16300 [Planctomycetaceae bacterium]|nr:hypothetical protein [Planctomycetaceae bacterium]
MSKTLLKELAEADCKPRKPASDAAVESVFRQFGVAVANPLCNLFSAAW